jgi:hypothetical protein
MIGGMTRGVQNFQAVLTDLQNFAMRKFAIGLELALRIGRAG